ncbi:hypothetical protein [Taklimakanibacter deserti]|uniref:hypothetical protein n=1 Tax=Taklimakanibacter deserti TaxID=2267839 RepID=UPI0013C4F359
MARYFRRLRLSGLAAALLLLFPTVAAAQFACAAHDDIVNELTQRFKEAPEANGLTPDGMLLEVFVSEARSWTILVTSPKGISCLAASGENWEREFRKPETGF